MPNSPDPTRPFFIVGAPRSGTTLLRLMLNAHSELCIPPESHFVVDLPAQIGEFDLDRAWKALQAHERFQEWKLAPSEVHRSVESAVDWSTFFDRVFYAYASQVSKPRWGDKTPIYSRSLPQLHDLFPQADILHIIRDGRDVAASLKTMPWFTGDMYICAETWRARVIAARENGRTLFADRYLEIRYEALVADPESVLRRVCEHLHLSFEPTMLEYHQNAAEQIPTERAAWHEGTKRPVNDAAIARWKNDLTPRELTVVEVAAGALLTRLGYERCGEYHVGAAISVWRRRLLGRFFRRKPVK